MKKKITRIPNGTFQLIQLGLFPLAIQNFYAVPSSKGKKNCLKQLRQKEWKFMVSNQTHCQHSSTKYFFSSFINMLTELSFFDLQMVVFFFFVWAQLFKNFPATLDISFVLFLNAKQFFVSLVVEWNLIFFDTGRVKNLHLKCQQMEAARRIRSINYSCGRWES